MSKIGKIVTKGNGTNAYVVIYENGENLRGIKLIQGTTDTPHFSIPKEEITKLNYKGKKLDDCSADLTTNESVSTVTGLDLREIGILSEDCYFKLLRRYINAQSLARANQYAYKIVRSDIHTQFVKMMKKSHK